MNLAFKFDNIQTLNMTMFDLQTFSADSKFIKFFSHTCRQIRTSGKHNRQHMFTPEQQMLVA